MARKLSQSDPALAIEFFLSGFYTHRSQLFAPFKGIGVNVVSFHDPVIDGANMEDTDLYEWQRRPGFSIFCSVPLADNDIVNQFYSSRNLNGTVLPFVDTTQRLALFSPTTLTTILSKTTTNQGYISTLGNMTYYSDGAAADLYKWDGANLSAWGLAPPTSTPAATQTALGFWQQITTFDLGDSILDPNGNIESVTAILIPNGGFDVPTAASTLALGGSLALTWAPETIHGGYSVTEGYGHIQQVGAYSSTSSVSATLSADVVSGHTIVVEIGFGSVNGLPTFFTIADNLGNVYTQQSEHHNFYPGGGGNNFFLTVRTFTAPVSVGGHCTITFSTTQASLQMVAHEVSGIGGTETTDATNFIVHPSSLNTGTVSFTGAKFVLSTILSDHVQSVTTPSGYTRGPSANNLMFDAYGGPVSPQSPTWTSLDSAGFALGVTTVLPISALATGYTPYLFLRDFLFAVPLGSTVVGVAVTIPKMNAGSGTVQDHSVKLVIGGAVVGSDQAVGTNWNNAGYAVVTYGGPTNMWGLGTINPADINTNGVSGFGVAISAQIVSTTGGSVIPDVGFTAPNQPTVTIYFQQANGFGGPGVSGQNEPVWPTTINGNVNDGGLTWTNYGNIQTWFPTTGYPTPVVILDPNGNLQLSTYVANPIAAWSAIPNYTFGQVVYFGGQFWISVFNGVNHAVVPTTNYATATLSGAVTTTAPYWAITTTPLVTGLIAPVWNTTLGGITIDGSYTWTNLGQGVGLAFTGHAYVYGYRTIYGHLTTGSPFSNNTGAILGPLNATITSFTIASNVVTFTGNNNFLTGNVFLVKGLSTGLYLNNQALTVIAALPSSTFPLTSVQVDGANHLIVQALNNLVAGQTVSFNGVGTAAFLNNVTVTVISTGLSSTQFEANFTHAAYGPTADAGNVNLNGSYTANFTHSDVSLTLDSGSAIALLATISGVGTGSPLCNATAAITAVSVTADIVTLTASNNFQPGLWVTINGLSNATFLNGQQAQVISVDQLVGTLNTQFQVFFQTPNYAQTADAGTATFNAVEIYRTSDGGGLYLFDGAVTNPGLNFPWAFNDFVIDDNLDELLIAPLGHQNDPPPGAAGSLVLKTGTITAYWQGRLWMIVGNYVYFSAGPDCSNGIPEEAWPPANRFQFAGPGLGLKPTEDGGGLLVYLADRVGVILGGPETISFYAMDALDNFGISNPNAIFKDGSIIGQFTTQQQYIELAGSQKNDVGEHIGDYLTTNFQAAKTYATLHRNGLDVGVFVSNGVDQVLRYGSNIAAWSVPSFPACGAGALRSIETSVGVTRLMLAAPAGGVTITTPATNPISGVSAGVGVVWANPGNITAGNPTSYATVTFAGAASSQILRAAHQLLNIPRTAVVQSIQLVITGKQTDISGALTLNVTPTNAITGAQSTGFTFGTTNTVVTISQTIPLWGMVWSIPDVLNAGALSFDITSSYTGGSTPVVSISEVQVIVTYQNPGNYLYARDLNSWGDGGPYGANTGLPYALCDVVIGSITLSQLGAPMFPLQHVVGYFNAVGTLNSGMPSQPDIWILPNEVNDKAGIGFVYLPEVLPEPPLGQNQPSSTILALRWPVNMANSQAMSQYMHHLQVKIMFQPENAPNTIKAIAFKSDQD